MFLTSATKRLKSGQNPTKEDTALVGVVTALVRVAMASVGVVTVQVGVVTVSVGVVTMQVRIIMAQVGSEAYDIPQREWR